MRTGKLRPLEYYLCHPTLAAMASSAEEGHCEAERVPLAHQLSPAPPSPRALRPFFRARWLVPCCWRWGGERLLKRLHGVLGRRTAQWLGRWTYLLN